MRHWPSVLALLFAASGGHVTAQVPSFRDTSTQVWKEWELGRRVVEDLEKRDGSIDDTAILGYVQHLANGLTNTVAMQPLRVRVTRSLDQYASLLPNRALYISAGLLDGIGNEAELAGLIAHELAHLSQSQQGSVYTGRCVLQSPSAPSWPEDSRDRELQATTAAISYLKSAGYDPAGLLTLLSRLAYEHPVWARAIVPQDLLELRASLESDALPLKGFRLDSSGFIQLHRRLETMLGRAEGAPRMNRPSLSPRR